VILRCLRAAWALWAVVRWLSAVQLGGQNPALRALSAALLTSPIKKARLNLLNARTPPIVCAIRVSEHPFEPFPIGVTCSRPARAACLSIFSHRCRRSPKRSGGRGRVGELPTGRHYNRVHVAWRGGSGEVPVKRTEFTPAHSSLRAPFGALAPMRRLEWLANELNFGRMSAGLLLQLVPGALASSYAAEPSMS
jgi:hypothetical protein